MSMSSSSSISMSISLKTQDLILDQMLISAKKRCLIPNANNGRAYMGAIILDRKCPLCLWL